MHSTAGLPKTLFLRFITLVACVFAPAHAQFAPALMRYNNIAETTYVLHRCGELTAEGRAWLHHLLDHTKRRLDWTAAQWAEHDAALTQDFERRYLSVDKVRCKEMTVTIDQERKTTAIVN